MEIDTREGVLTIVKQGEGDYIEPNGIMLGDKRIKRYRISHDELMKAKELKLKTY